MKNIMGVGMLMFCLVFIVRNTCGGVGERSGIGVGQITTEWCVCYEYYFNNLEDDHRTVYQTCDSEVLDYRDDKTLVLVTLTISCDSVFDGTRIVDLSY